MSFKGCHPEARSNLKWDEIVFREGSQGLNQRVVLKVEIPRVRKTNPWLLYGHSG